MSYYLAASLVALRAEIDARYPKRDKTSDGWIGDPSHAARVSDHNPDAKGCVHAIDVDIDDNDPEDLRLLLIAAAIAHPATYYVISNRVIYSRSRGFVGQPYDGTNPHDRHVHVSILSTYAAENSVIRWFSVAAKVKTQVQLARQKLRQARVILTDAGKNRPAAKKAAERVGRTLSKLPRK